MEAFIGNYSIEELAKGDDAVENAVKNYQQQKARMEGIQEKFQQTREQQYEESDRSIQAHDNNGMVYATQLKDEPVFITGGNVALNEDGTIDVDNSSETLYVKFPDGHVEMTSPDKFTEVFTSDRTADLKAAKRAEIDAKWKAEFDTAEAQSVEQEKREAGVVFNMTDAQGNHRIEILNEGEDMSNILFDGAETEIPTEELNCWKQEAGVQAENVTQTTETTEVVGDQVTEGGVPGQSGVLLSDEVDENGRQFVLNSKGDIAFGEILEDSGLTPAPILLSEGLITNPATNDGYGLVHIEARHGDQIRNAGYNSVVEFVEEVAKNYEVIREGKDRNGQQTYMLQLTDKHNNTLMVELSGDGTYWNINTAGIFKTSYGKNRKEVYNRHTTAKQPTETVEASQDAEQSGTQAASSMNAPTTSLSEDTASVSNSQENTQKSGENNQPDVPDFFRLNGTNYEVASRNDDGSVDVMVNGKRETLPAGTDYSTYMPTDKKGEVQYEQMPVERTHEYFVQRVKDDEARAEMIEKRRKKAEAERKKFDKKPDPGIDPDAYEAKMTQWEADKKAAQAKVDYWNEIAKRDAEITRSETREAVENIKPDVMKETADEFIANQLAGIKITPESFKRETGLSNAEQAQLVGVISNDGVSVERAAEIILENYDSELKALGFTGDVQDVRDIIISVLSQGNPRSYAKKGREAREAENMYQQRADAEVWAKGAFDMTLDELYLYEETILPRMIRDYEGFDENEYYSNLAENNGYDTTRESESISRGGELLQGEQPVPAGGTPVVGQRNEGGAVSDDVQGDGQNGVAQGETGQVNNETLSQGTDQVGDQVTVPEGNAPGKSGVDHSLSQEEAQVFITEMEANAEVAPEIELTIENWDSLFGEDGLVETPIGEVKMGENQFTKLMRQGRDGKLGMVKPTLENPDVIIEDESKAKNGETERPSSYVFVKSFKKADGSRYYYFTSVTVSKDGKEVIVSNQEKRRNAIANLLTNGKLVWKHADNVSNASDVANGLYSSQGNSSDLAAEGTDAPQTNVGVNETPVDGSTTISPEDNNQQPADTENISALDASSESEGTAQDVNLQENAQESGEIAENGGEIQETAFLETLLDNGDKKITGMNSRGEVATVTIERDGKVVSVDSYDEGVLFEHTEYDGNGKASSVTRYDKSGNVVGAQKYVNGIESKAFVKETMRTAPLRKRAEKWMKDTGVPVRLIGIGDEITNSAARRVINAGEKVTGWIDNNEVVLYLPNISNEKEIDDTFVHEVVAHKGLKALMGKDFDALCDKVWEMMSEEQRAKFINYPGVNGDTRKAADEYMAHLAEGVDLTDADKTVWQRIVEAVREFLVKHGMKMTDGDIENLIKASYSRLRAQSTEYREQRKDAQFRIAEVNERFNNELQQQIDGTLPKGHIYELGMPSEVLRSAGLPNLPIELAASRLSDKSMQENHPFELSEIKGLVEAVQEPLAVFRSATRLGSFVVLTEIQHEGRNYVVAIETNRDKGRIQINSVRSIHYRNSNKHIANWIEEGLLEYADKKRMSEWLSKQQYNSADVRNLFRHSAKLVESFENPTIESENTLFRTTYHGSGAKFDRFDHSFMGTGEGAQAFGWGTYVTEVEGIGKQYAEAGNYGFAPLRAKIGNIDAALHMLDSDIERAKRELEQNDNETAKERAKYIIENAEDRRESLYKERTSVEKEMSKLGRNLYSVEIPDDNGSNYLHWEDVVPKKVETAVKERLLERLSEGQGEAYKSDLKQELDDVFRYSDFDGASLYRNISAYVGGDKQASLFLNDMGFVGISYPANATTGGRADGARNYVIFNENDAQIENRTQFRIVGDAQNRKDSERRKEKVRLNNAIDTAVGFILGSKELAKKRRLKREADRKELAKEIYSSVLKGDFNDVTLSQIDKFIEDATPANPFGRRISQRLPQRMERGLRQGARTNAVDALFSRICESTVPANERFSEAGRREIEERKKELLKGWAIATGNWHTDLKEFTDDTEPIGEGKDSKVYMSKDGNSVIKASKGKPFGKKFRPDIDNIPLFNDVFKNSRYEILGYGEIDGQFVRILKQDFIDFAESTPLTPEERKEYMGKLGFKPLNKDYTAFSNGEIVIADLQKSNIVKDAAGNISVIDADAKLHTKDVGGDYTYPPVEEDLPKGATLDESEISATPQDSEDGIRFSIKNWNNNRGYTQREDGSRISVRAADAEADGAFTAGTFRKVYGVSKADFDALVEIGAIVNSEWHHTGANFKESDFYSWRDRGDMDYTDGVPEEGSLGDVYSKNKKDISRLVKEYQQKDWEYEDKQGEVHLPGLNDFASRVVKLNAEERADAEREHAEISGRGEELGGSHVRRLMHEEVDARYAEIARKRFERENPGELERLYEEEYGESIAFNRGLAERNNAAEEHNRQTTGKEAALLKIADILGVDARGKVEGVSRFARENAKREQRKAEAETIKQSFEAEMQRKQKALDKWLAEQRKKGVIKDVERIPKKDAPELFVAEKEEMNGRYGWFEASTWRYNLPVYVSGMEFANKRLFDGYQKRVNEIRDAKNKFDFEYTKFLYEGNNDGEALRRLVADPRQMVRELIVPFAKELREEQERRNEKEERRNEGTMFRFIGEKGAANLDRAEEATTRLDNLAVAREMESAGKEAKAIKLATGWERGADGKWRYETEDAKVNTGAELFDLENFEYYPIARSIEIGRVDDNSTIRLTDLVKDDELFKAYPEMERYFVSFEEMDDNTKGSHSFEDKMIRINKDDISSLESTLVHEIQHAIQSIEGFARGGNSSTVAPKVQTFRTEVAPLHNMMLDTPEWAEKKRLQSRWLDEWEKPVPDESYMAQLQERVDEIDNSGVLKEIEAKQNELIKKYGYNKSVLDIISGPYSDDADIWNRLPESFYDKIDAYRRLAGEVESRNVQERMGMTEEERRNSLAAETEDVAREDQVFIYDGLKSAMAADDLFVKMNENAELLIPRLLTEEIWENEIRGKKFKTPIGDVKLGENQYEKNKGKGREREFGMIIPTLERPDFIFEEVSPEEGAERQTKYVFVKAFYDSEGNKHVYYADVSVLKDGMEAVTSSHHLRDKQVLNKIRKEQMLWNRFASDSMSSAQGGSTDQSNAPSADKGSDNSSNTQEGEARFRTVEETAEGSIDDIQAQPLTLMERITNSLLEVSAKNKENLGLRASALRTFGRDINRVLSLMKAQREYDKSTVDTLVKLAKMYFQNAQLLGEVTPYEVARIMGVLNRSVGKRDISTEAAKLMDILLDAHTNALAGILDKAEKIKAKKVNAAGVEVMGRLDKYGQKRVDEYRAAKEMTPEKLEEAIFDSDNRLAELEQRVREVLGLPEGDVDQAAREYTGDNDVVNVYMDERARLEGLTLAREYKESIQQVQEEIKDLKKELKQAEEDYRLGNIDGKSLKEFRKSVAEAIMESKAELIEGYHSLIYKFQENTKESSQRAKEFAQAQIDRAREIQHNANSDMEGIPADTQGTHPDNHNNAVMNALRSPFPTFQGMLKKFGEKNVEGKGYLYERFMPQATQASDSEFRGKVTARVMIETKLKEIYGKKMSIAKFMKQLREYGATVTYREGNKMKQFDLTKGQMLYIYMVNKMADGQMKLRRMGITDDVVAELAEKMDLNELERSTWDKIVDWFKELLENIGFENLTKEDIESMLKASYSRLKGEIQFRIAEVNDKFNSELESLNEENADKVVLNVGNPSPILLSAGVEDRPMKLYGNKIIKKAKKHGFKIQDLKNLPSAVADPIAVFDNYQQEGNRSILTELRTADGNILATVDLGKGMDIDFNIISSAFGKSDNKIVSWINKGFATYINKEKALDYLHLSAPIAEASDKQELSSAAKIVESFENPTVESENSANPQDAESGIRFRKKDSERRQEKRRINDAIDTAAGFITMGGKKQATKNRLKKEAERKQLAKEIYSSVLKGDFNDVTLSQIDKFIEDATPANPFGRRISQRLPQRMERALRQGARTNAVDALFSRISESAVPANGRFSEAGRREIEERKKELLKGWAIATGNWHTDLKEFTDDNEPIGEGKDSKVYSSKDGRYVIKASKGKPYGKRFRPDIDNIALFNDVFRDTRYEILGYGEIDGEFVRILQQPIVDFAQSTPLTSEERREYMQSLGFEPLNDANTAFADGEIVIADLQKGNVVRDAAGNISVIDADAKLHTKDVGGDYTYPPVEEDLPKGATLDESEISATPQDSEDGIRFRVVTDPAKIAELESGEKIKTYRAMQVIDGKLYPPMSAKVDGKLREPIELGKWEEAEERPDLADDKGYFKLDKGNKTSLKARYNPYIHTSTTPLNDQFSSAQDRPELVTVEVEIPASELTSGYKAEKAKDAVGKLEWKAGVVQGKLSGTRTVILSRWDKPIRIVPDSEVADRIVEMFGDREIVMPSNVVTPSLRAELEERGVPFVETDNQGKPMQGQTMFRIKDYSAEEKEIIAQAKADGSYMKAPNGKPTNLNERQWVQVRTANFKKWFGDWEKVARIEKLKKSDPVNIDFNNEYELNRDSAKQWMKDNLRGEYTNADTGENIAISKVGINEVTSHGSQDAVHLISLKAVPQFIENSVFIEEVPNAKDNDKYDSYRYYVCGARINGEDYTVKVVIGVKGDSKFYDHRLTQIEKGTLIDNLNGLSNSVAENQNTSLTGKDSKLISILQTNVSKVVDENSEPMVVYHQTNSKVYINVETGENWDDLDWKAKQEWDERDDWEDFWEEQDFNTFSRVNARTTHELDGFFFAPEYDEYHEYGDRTIAAFLNITNPASREDYDVDGSVNNAGREERLRLQNEGFDGVIREEDGKVWEYIAFEPNQIKSADPVTYDDNGNVIPLSERFNEEKEDIRFRITDTDRQALEFKRQHKGSANIVAIDTDALVPELLAQGFDAEEIQDIMEQHKKGVQGFYDRKRKTIYLLGKDHSEKENSATLWHESTHKAIGDMDFPQEVMDEFYTMPSKRFIDFFEKKAKEFYGPEEYAEELIAYFVEDVQSSGSYDNVTKALGTSAEGMERLKEIVEPIINYINHGRRVNEGTEGNHRTVVRGTLRDINAEADQERTRREAEGAGTKETRFRTVEEGTDSSIDDIQTQPLTLMERITNSLLEVSAKNKENLGLRASALRTFGRDINRVLSLMKAQREYDKSTVDTLVKLAKMYFQNAQLLGEVTPYEVARIMGVLNRMARMFTSQNPAFIVTNLSRDIIWAGTVVATKENPEYVKMYTKNITKALAKGQLPILIHKFQKGTLDADNELERYFIEFMENGGETGFTQINTVEDYKRNIKRFMKEAKDGVNITTKAWRGFWGGVEFLNRSAEDTTRFMVYMTSRQLGRTVAQSIWDAKEVTVNFNKKGSGEMGAKYLNFAYIFFNATMQALSNFGKLIVKHPGRTTAALSIYSALGFFMPMINAAIVAMFGGDEEDYWDLPEWVRRNNIVMFAPWTEKGFITIPLPHELRPFYGMGEAAYSALAGKEDVEDAIYGAMNGFTGLLPLDYTGNGGNALVNITPTIFQPYAQVKANVDYFGKPIYRDNPFNENAPEWTKAYKGTNRWLVGAAEWLNMVTGGNEVKRGLINLNPAVVEHLIEGYTGGLGKTVNKTWKTISMLWDEDVREARNIPVISSFYQEADERSSGSRLNREYFEALEELKDAQFIYSGYRKRAESGSKEYQELLEEFVNSKEFRRLQIIKNSSGIIKQLDDILKDRPLTEEQEKAIKDEITYLKTQMLNTLEDLEEEEPVEDVKKAS